MPEIKIKSKNQQNRKKLKKVLDFYRNGYYNNEVGQASPTTKWDLSSAGRASALQAEGHRFEPCRSH